MRAFLFLLVGLVVYASPSLAQTGTSTSKLVLDQQAPDLATANAYIYRYYADGVATGTVITMTCTGTSAPYTCSGSMPAFTPGPHAVTFTAANVAGESAKSAVVSFTFVVIPSAPQNPRVQ